MTHRGLSVNRLTEVPDVVAEHTFLQQLCESLLRLLWRTRKHTLLTRLTPSYVMIRWLNNNSISELPSSLELPNLKILYVSDAA